MKRTTKKTILLSKEAYLFLQNKMKYERSGKIFPKEFIAKLERNFNNLQHDVRKAHSFRCGMDSTNKKCV